MKKNTSTVWIMIVVSFLILNLNNGVAALISFWLIYGLAWLIPKKRVYNQKMCLWEQEQAERNRREEERRFLNSGFDHELAKDLKKYGKIEELKRYYNAYSHFMDKIKARGWYYLDD